MDNILNLSTSQFCFKDKFSKDVWEEFGIKIKAGSPLEKLVFYPKSKFFWLTGCGLTQISLIQS